MSERNQTCLEPDWEQGEEATLIIGVPLQELPVVQGITKVDMGIWVPEVQVEPLKLIHEVR